MYILSRDRLNMDLDRASLDLMIRLLELEQDKSIADQLTTKEMNKVKEKIRKLCETVHNKHLDLENITVSLRSACACLLGDVSSCSAVFLFVSIYKQSCPGFALFIIQLVW